MGDFGKIVRMSVTRSRIFNIWLQIAVLTGGLTGGYLAGEVCAEKVTNPPSKRYQPILDRGPFGAVPVAPTEEPAPEPEVLVPEVPEVIPPVLANVKVTLISRFRGVPAAGFTDGESNTPYYLMVGQSNVFELVSVDFSAQTIRLRRDGLEADLPLWVNPATTNQADLMSFGMPTASASAPASTAPSGRITGGVGTARPSTGFRGPTPRPLSPEAEARREAFRKRREEARKKREEERERMKEEMSNMTPEQRERRLHDLNVEIIANGDAPPLPITLDEQDMKKLSDKGFAIPGYNTPTSEGGK